MRIFFSTFLAAVLTTMGIAQGLYDTDQVTVLEITFQDNNWHQTLNGFYAADNGERLMATVEINGNTFDSVGVRYRGGGTYDASNTKNPLNIKLDYLKNQDYQGFDVLKLSNGAKDPSWLREVLGYEIARNFMEAPKANYASVYVNGNFLGLYANVESINSKFFGDRFFSNSANTRFEADPTYDFDDIPNPPFGCTEGHGAALENLGVGDGCYFEHYELQSAIGWSELRELASHIQNNPDNLRDLLDIDRFIWVSSFNNLLANLDSYLGAIAGKYFIFKSDNGHWMPVMDDLNESFARYPWLTIPNAGDPQPGLDLYTDIDLFHGDNLAEKPLLDAMFSNSTTKRMYVAHVRTMINQLFDTGWFDDRAMALQSLIEDEVQSDNNHFYTYDEFLENYNQTVVDSYDGEDAYGLFPLMDGRIAYLLSQPELQATPPTIGNVAVSNDMPMPGSSINITASIGNANTIRLGHRNNRTEMFQLIEMKDDGNNGDGSAGDGVYGAPISVPVGGIQYYIYAENNDAGMFSPERAEFVFYELNATGSVVINELMASNQSTVSDQNGQFDDWAELYNNSSSTIDLSGWYLSDDLQNLTKYQFPNGVTLNANSYLTIWCDDDETQPGLHTTFNLSASGEALVLVRPDMSVADQIVFGSQTTDVSYGRCPNGAGSFTFIPPSFNGDNTGACSTDTEEEVAGIGIKIFPNPVNGLLNIETSLIAETNGTLWSPVGKKVRSFSFTGNTLIEVNELPSGIYFLEVEGVGVKRVIVQNGQ